MIRRQVNQVVVIQNDFADDLRGTLEPTPQGIRMNRKHALTLYCNYKRRLLRHGLFQSDPGLQSLRMIRCLLARMLKESLT